MSCFIKKKDTVLAFIEQELCSRLGPLADTCKTYVETYGRTIIHELAQKVVSFLSKFLSWINKILFL